MKDRPSFNQVRRKVQNEVTIDDFVEKFAVIYLQFLQKQATTPSTRSAPMRILTEVSPNVLSASTNLNTAFGNPIITHRDKEVLAIIETLKVKKEWPRKRGRLKQFLDEKKFDDLRRYSSDAVFHRPVVLDLPNKEQRKQCVLCKKGNNGRNATHYCSICLVPLCTTILRHGTGEAVACTCFQRFHQCIDLERQARRCHDWLLQSRGHCRRVMNFKKSAKTIENKTEDKENDVEKVNGDKENVQEKATGKRKETDGEHSDLDGKIQKLNDAPKKEEEGDCEGRSD